MSEARRPANARRSPPVRFQPAPVACVVPQRVPVLRQRGREKDPRGSIPKRCHRMERCVTMAAFREEFDRVPDNTVEK